MNIFTGLQLEGINFLVFVLNNVGKAVRAIFILLYIAIALHVIIIILNVILGVTILKKTKNRK